jgi:DNA modification methylase/DNA-directed RNA polymerase subunit RPC12/RpoP
MTDDLKTFLAQYSKPYEVVTDDYRRSPFAEPVKAARSGIVYNAHTYHTKVPAEGIIPYLGYYTEPGDLVLDPFCGSGMTGVACMLSGRAVILNDLSPAAIHITRNYNTPVQGTDLKNEFLKIKNNVKEEFDWLYGTICDSCGQLANIQYTIWSDVYECGRCGSEILWWDRALHAKTEKVSDEFPCPACGKEWRKSQLKRLKTIPVLVNYICTNCNKRGEHTPTVAELARIKDISVKPIPYWFPTDELDHNSEMYIRGALQSRNIDRVDQFYTNRNLWALARLWEEINSIEDIRVRMAMQFVFTAVNAAHATIMTRIILKGGKKPILTSSQSGIIYVPSLSVEKNVMQVMERKLRDVVELASQIMPKYTGVSFTRVGSATHIPEISGNTIDYVFTDPPFGMNLYYSDLNFISEAWLGIFTDSTEEAVVHREQKNKPKSLNDYKDLMTKAFQEIYRVLKPGRWASVVFHNSDDKIWQVILDAAEVSGFEVADINAFDKVQLSFKGIRGAKGLERVTNRDIVLNLRKPREQEPLRTNERADQVEAEQKALETVADFLTIDPPPAKRTLQHIWNHVLYSMIRSGNVQVSMAGLAELLSYHYQTFKVVDGKYYLRGEAVVGGNVFDLRTDAGAIAWLNSLLTNEPLTTGELIPRWQQETAHLGASDPQRLDILLDQNFWQEQKDGKWRIPTPTEREKMSAREDLSSQAHLRVIRRFLDGSFDRRPSNLELAAWIRFCYNREFYSEAAALFDHITETGLDGDEYKTIKKMSSIARMKK